MKPYKSGKNEWLLRKVQTDTWRDMFPPTNTPLYYAVSYVEGNGNEIMKGNSQKVRKIVYKSNYYCYISSTFSIWMRVLID